MEHYTSFPPALFLKKILEENLEKVIMATLVVMPNLSTLPLNGNICDSSIQEIQKPKLNHAIFLLIVFRVVEPMQIDTHNRNYSINDQVGLKPSFLPKMVINNMTDLKSGLSPLIECPCSDRITKNTVSSASILTTGTCHTGLTSETVRYAT